MENITENEWPIKNRYLFLIFILSFFSSIILWLNLAPDYFSDDSSPMSDVLFSYVWYGILLLLIYLLSNKSSIDWQNIIGKIKTKVSLKKYVLMVFALFAISIAGILIIFYPLSFLLPNTVEGLFIDNDAKMIWMNGEQYKLANVFSFLGVVIVAPIVEEIFFRGFLLTSLNNKYGIKKAILISSILFCILHLDLIGSFVMGLVISVVYIKTSTLLLPIIIHIANNAIVFIVSAILIFIKNNSEYSLTDFQSNWWIGIICLAIGLPWFIHFYWKEMLGKTFEIPYLQNARYNKAHQAVM